MAKKRSVGRYPKGFRQMAVERLKSCDAYLDERRQRRYHHALYLEPRAKTMQDWAD